MSLFNIKKTIKEKQKTNRLQEVEKEMLEPMGKPPSPNNEFEEVDVTNTKSGVAEASKPEDQTAPTQTSKSEPELEKGFDFSDSEKKEMAYVFKDKYDQTKKELGGEIESLDMEMHERLKLIKKEFQRRVEEIQLEHTRSRNEIKDRFETKMQRFRKLMSKLGEITDPDKILDEPLKEVAEPVSMEEKFEPPKSENLIPITEDDRRLGSEINDFLKSIANKKI